MFTESGGYLGMHRDHDANRREFARHSPRDAEAYDRYARDVLRHCRFIRPMLMRTPPDPSSFRPRDLAELAWLGKQMFGLSETAMYDMIRFWMMSISDLLEEYFENPVIKAYQAVASIISPPWVRCRPAPPMCCCTTPWAMLTAMSGPGALRAAGWGRSPKRLPRHWRRWVAKFAQATGLTASWSGIAAQSGSS